MVIVNVGGQGYYLNPKLKSVWDKIKDGKLNKIDEDRIYITDGRERSGKSVFTLQQAAYIDPTIIEGDIPRVTFSAEETLKAIRTTESSKDETKVIIFDEAFRGLSSKSHQSRINKKIIQSMMEMGQKNLVMFLVSPSFFLLEMYSAVLRSEALFHIAKNPKSNRRYFRLFNYKKKATLYDIGIRKGWGYPIHTRLRDSFPNKYPGGDTFEAKYRAKKALSIKMMDEEDKKPPKETKYSVQRDTLIYAMYKDLHIAQKDIASLVKKYNFTIGQDAISRICSHFKQTWRKNMLNVD